MTGVNDSLRLDRSWKRSSFVRIEAGGRVVTARLLGPGVGPREAPIIAREVTDALDQVGWGLQVLVLDLTRVRMMSSMGLGLCVELRHRAHAAGAKTIIKAEPELASLFRMMKLDRLCIIAADATEVDRALAA